MKKFFSILLIPALAGIVLAGQYTFSPDGGTTIMNVTSSGVAIGKGKTAASTALDIVGDVAISGTITGAVADASITSAKIASGAVTTPKVASAAVTSDKIASAAVTTAKIDKTSGGAGALCEMNDGTGKFGHCTNADASVCGCL